MTVLRQPRALRALALALPCAALLAACEREERRFSEIPPTATANEMVTVSDLQPGASVVHVNLESPYDDKAWNVSEGKRIFASMNCSGCHANGGGGMGPALMDDEWIYGSQPEQIFATIAEGRPNGMPAWKYKLSNQQIWELVAYVRSLASLDPKGARSGRDEHMMVKPAEQQSPIMKPKSATRPPASTSTSKPASTPGVQTRPPEAKP